MATTAWDSNHWFMLDPKYTQIVTFSDDAFTYSWDEPEPETEMQRAIREAVAMVK